MDRRVFLIVLDSAGIGGAPDAHEFGQTAAPRPRGDEGANTIRHIAEHRAGQGTPLALPNMAALGLGRAMVAADGGPDPFGVEPTGRWAAATEVSRGKDTPSGHWEIAGVPVPFDWHYFPQENTFAPDLLAEIADIGGTSGTLHNGHASGMPVIREHGAEHLRTGDPIVYTSADSVLQIAAHEGVFGLDRLLHLCEAIAPRLHAMRVGRVIARPFVGEPGAWERTTNRRDFAMAPPSETILDAAQAAGRHTRAIGKIGDIFAHRGIDASAKGSDEALMGHLAAAAGDAPDGALVFANLVEFDTLYGHERNPDGYAAALERFDGWLPGFLAAQRPGDLTIVTADHGNDPTWAGTDHTRERVPVLIHGAGAGPLGGGHCGFADMGATAASWLGLGPHGAGRDLL